MSSNDVGLDPDWVAVSRLARLADHWGLVVAYGVITLGLGIVLAVWPGETLLVCAVLIAIQLLVTGAVRILRAIGAAGLSGGARMLHALTGALALIVGLLCLRDPLQTLLALGIILGAWWLVSGVMDVISVLTSSNTRHRLWEIAMGVVTALAGGFLLVNPELSLGLLVFVMCIWLVSVGILAVIEGMRVRSEQQTMTAITHATPPSPAS